MYLMFYPYTEKNNHWHFMHEYVAGQWKLNTYNRMRLWIKVPKQYAATLGKGGRANTQIGTFVRASAGKETGSGAQESGLGGTHYYHHFNIPYTGEWHQLILDAHPTHQRGGAGNFEWGDAPHPTGEQGYNYFDLLTYFYLDLSSQTGLPSYPATFYFDDVELYQDTNPENTEQVFSLNGVYVPSSNTVMVGWSHPKDDTGKYEVRYSFEDIFATGWANAKPAPGGVVAPLSNAYNTVEYSTSALHLAGHDRVMIAIKPRDSERFRQIVIPLRHTEGH